FRLKLGLVENIDIFIYDIAGFSIKRISLQNLGINNQIFEIPWDISNIESGVYIARIVVKNINSTDEKIIKLGIAK
ncbi:T9SS type A sorting domain-containing protein, partial [Candidatus Marinimicrobia bacterium]|nr:T9SS type A sorting domain-containing protein [Candidatus Neomarinimicrobiota bacterium]